MGNKKSAGHMAALVTITIWGTTYISTKVLLTDFLPIEILFFRFLMGLFVLVIAYPHRLKGTTLKQELTFAAAGLTGVTMYYLMENIALTYTYASNVGVIISVAPFFTAILTWAFMKGEEKPGINFFIGFVIAIVGICLLSFGGDSLQINPLGDLLGLGAAFIWAVYSVISRKISSFGYNVIQSTRKIFLYGVLFMAPALPFFDFSFELTRFANPVYLFNILFLGLGASALCFVTWNYAVKVLGAVTTSLYIYLNPVVTVVTSILVLHERITKTAALGILLTLAGLLVSGAKFGALRKRADGKGQRK